MIIQQWCILSSRNFRVLCKDKRSLLILLGQVPVIALLMVLAFYQSGQDYASVDRFARVDYHFVQEVERAELERRPLMPGKLWREAMEAEEAVRLQADRETPLMISEFGARQRGAIYFIFVAASIWFGVMGACTEVVGEQHILKRELSSIVHPMPYLGAKLFMLMVVVGMQTAFLVIIAGPLLLHLQLMALIKLWLILWLSGTAAVCLGLCVSALSTNVRFALAFVPLLIIPQLLFGGLVRPLNLDGVGMAPRIIGALTLQRWGFEAALYIDPYAEGKILQQTLDLETGGKLGEFKIVRFQEKTLADSFFRKKKEEKAPAIPSSPAKYSPLLITVTVLFGYCLLFSLITWRRIKKRFSLQYR